VDMNRIAHSYAKGDFSRRLQVNSRDEIGQLGESLNQMAEELSGTEEMRRSFVANVSHELKAPLASMRGFVQAVLDGSVPQQDQNEYLGIVLDETMRLSGLINDLLDLSKIESGKFPLNITLFDINDFLARILLTFETRIEDKKIDVQVDFSQQYCIVAADSDKISQVFRNLIDNAIKFTPQGGSITISTTAAESRAIIRVTDSGCGIPPEDVPHIFERFYKVEKAHTPGGDGTGLGLSIAKRILEQHNADIWLESKLGQGTTFTVALPLGPKHNKPVKEKENKGAKEGRGGQK
jgi:signal transduction histidine kinase